MKRKRALHIVCSCQQRWLRPLALTAAVVLMACSTEAVPPADTIVVRQEDGVTVVENPGLHVADSLKWRIDTASVVQVGLADGPAEYTIGRLTGMMTRADGSILIADGIAHDLRVFDRRGKFVRRTGRAGDGPGEYGWLHALHAHAADSIAVVDNEGGRITVLDGDLGYSYRFLLPRIPDPERRPHRTYYVRGVFGDGTLLMMLSLTCDGGSCGDRASFVRADRTGRVLADFGRFLSSRSGGTRVGDGVAMWWEPLPQTMWAARGDRFYYADAQRFEVRVFRLDGALERIIRVAAEPRRYTRDEARPYIFAISGDVTPQQARRALDDVTPPDTFPFFSNLIVDDGGNIWLREYAPLGRSSQPPPRWFVFDPEGRLCCALRAPAALVTNFERSGIAPWIADDLVLARHVDGDGVESVLLYPLIRH